MWSHAEEEEARRLCWGFKRAAGQEFARDPGREEQAGSCALLREQNPGKYRDEQGIAWDHPAANIGEGKDRSAVVRGMRGGSGCFGM